MIGRRAAMPLWLCLVAAACNDSVGARPVARLEVSPAQATLAPGTYLPLTGTPVDQSGKAIPNIPVTWSSSTPEVASVEAATGLVLARSPGTATLTATAGGQAGSAEIRVEVPVAAVVLTPDSVQTDVGASAQLTATLRDAQGNPLDGRPIVWTSTNPAAASVDGTGVVRGLAAGITLVIATAGYRADTARVRVRGPVARINVQPDSIRLFVNGRLEFWATMSDSAGNPLYGRITWETSDAGIVQVTGLGERAATVTGMAVGSVAIRARSEGVVASVPVEVINVPGEPTISAGAYHTCGISIPGETYCWGRGYGTTPVRIVGAPEFKTITAGESHTCALTSDGAAYCWGGNNHGQLGNGSVTPWSATPVPVSPWYSYRFVSISAGATHTCARMATGKLYCWGDNRRLQLGVGTTAPYIAGAVEVQSIRVRWVGAGLEHTCAVRSDPPNDGSLLCWGSLHTDRPYDYNSPYRIRYSVVTSGGGFHCALIAEGSVSCGGYGLDGQFGSGPIGYSGRAAGGMRFHSISAGGKHTCALDSGGRAYCWGRGEEGQLGDGAGTTRVLPVSLGGTLRLRTVECGYFHCVALTTDGVAYGWGGNASGELGDGSAVRRLVPVLVSGGLTFR